ncbi:NepR family anti-sigma factor [Loktanella sp. SALINAS62]|uniref:NepR family anti-sigma factor n=1 Tax=Loktanella sp. SALINAS62 TaxID=2706124 RepID=UPI001B8CBC74|nr:NepR family anti-sigma factor [Loktanella sp. SALINAS62]MBS1302233.1 regulator [Loktanella sp. SALINAS62]
MSNDPPSDKARQQIDANLKRVFQAQEQAELPDRLKQLLEKLKAQDNAAGGQ